MDVAWYCCCCYSADLLEILRGPQLEVYYLICNIKVPEDDHTQIAACPQCRKFLKDVHSFRIERCEVGEIIADKPHKDQFIFRHMTDDNQPQMRIKPEIIDECNEMERKSSQQLFEINHDQHQMKNDQEKITTIKTKEKKINFRATSKFSDESVEQLSKPFLCIICNRLYTTFKTLTAHIRTYHNNDKDKPHKCSECSYSTLIKGSLKQHILLKHSDEKPFSCDICGYRCKTKYLLPRHIRLHTNVNEIRHKCSECSFVTTKKQSLQNHMASKHSDEKPFSCNMCSYRCKIKWQLTLHLKGHINGKPHKCSECSYASLYKRSLSRHIASNHSDDRRFYCDMCGYSCKYKRTLKVHIKTHTNFKGNFQKCSKCSYTTSYENRLKRHILSKHSDEKPFSCGTCDYRCKFKEQLSRHILGHVYPNERPHKCSECSYTTTRKDSLRTHMTFKHSDEKPFSCNICGYRCKFNRHLIRHIRTHMDVSQRPHKCSECSFSTINQSRLKAHISSKHRNERTFSCDLCDFRCKRHFSLLRHTKTHLNINEKPFKIQ